MTSTKSLALLALFTLIVGAGWFVATQEHDPTGRATGLTPADGIIDVQYFLADRVTVYPAPGAVDVAPAWDGNEVPQPQAPPGGYPSGPVITVQQQDYQLEIGDGHITKYGSDVPIPSTLMVQKAPGTQASSVVVEDTNLPKGTVGLIPHSPLEAQTTYTVTFVDQAGEVVAQWPFTTGASQCDVTAQDCGRGMGCYMLSGEPVCTWAGSSMKEEKCAHLNACAPGLTCFRGRCQPYCDESPSAAPDVSCKEQCGQGGYAIPGAEESDAKVCLAQNCLLSSVTCPKDEACYRFNELYLCAEVGAAPAGGACQYPNDCVEHTSCMGIDGVFSCRQLCDGPDMPACTEICANGYRTIFTSPLVRYCR
jgi:hypothetical protein